MVHAYLGDFFKGITSINRQHKGNGAAHADAVQTSK